MAVVESRIRNGTLTFDGSPDKVWSCQVLDCRCTPTHTTGDQVETLCGDQTTPTTETTWVLKGKIVSDFAAEASGSVVRWTHQEAGNVWNFDFLPNDGAGTDSITGDCTILPLELGGEVNTRIELDFEFPMTGAPTYTPVT